jgi:hypothetical protein
VKLFGEFVWDVAWLAGLGVCAWFFPKTILVAEAICALGTIALMRVEKGMI